MSKYLENLVEERETLAAALEGFTSKAATENRDLTESELSEVTKINGRAAEIDHALSIFGESQDANSRYAELMGRIKKRSAVKETQESPLETRSWGQAFAESQEARSYVGRGASGIVEVPFSLETRAFTPPGTIGTTSIVFPASIYSPIKETERFPLLAALSKETVNSGAVEWIEESRASDAAIVAEGDAKPEATLTLTPKTGSLKTLAHWKAITRQAAEDYPRLQSIVDGKLRNGVLRKIQKDAVTAISAVTGTAEGDTLLGAIRVGMAEVQDAGFSPDYVLLNPADYADLDITVMATNIAGPSVQSQFWGLRPIADAGVTAGTAIVGELGGATVFSRGNVAVYMTDSHADFFIRNQLVVLAEVRALSVVTEPLAFVKCTVAAP
jgi:HK97 family phage major capsid protein